MVGCVWWNLGNCGVPVGSNVELYVCLLSIGPWENTSLPCVRQSPDTCLKLGHIDELGNHPHRSSFLNHTHAPPLGFYEEEAEEKEEDTGPPGGSSGQRRAGRITEQQWAQMSKAEKLEQKARGSVSHSLVCCSLCVCVVLSRLHWDDFSFPGLSMCLSIQLRVPPN